MTQVLPVSSMTFSPPSRMPVRTSGPLVSSRMATGMESSRESERTFSIILRWYSWLPWEKLKRATFMP